MRAGSHRGQKRVLGLLELESQGRTEPGPQPTALLSAVCGRETTVCGWLIEKHVFPPSLSVSKYSLLFSPCILIVQINLYLKPVDLK